MPAPAVQRLLLRARRRLRPEHATAHATPHRSHPLRLGLRQTATRCQRAARALVYLTWFARAGAPGVGELRGATAARSPKVVPLLLHREAWASAPAVTEVNRHLDGNAALVGVTGDLAGPCPPARYSSRCHRCPSLPESVVVAGRRRGAMAKASCAMGPVMLP
jgi:hypothetical protein